MKTTAIYTPEALAFFTVRVPAKGNWGKPVQTAQEAADVVERYRLSRNFQVLAVDLDAEDWHVQVQATVYDSVGALRILLEDQQDRLATGGYRLVRPATIFTKEA